MQSPIRWALEIVPYLMTNDQSPMPPNSEFGHGDLAIGHFACQPITTSACQLVPLLYVSVIALNAEFA